ncbi:MAG: DNA gyrase subunit A, partial [Acidobacteriota bacterium]
DSSGRIVVGEGRYSRITRRNAQLIELTFDDGSKVRCTPDHRFMLRDGSWKEAQELTIEDSLMHQLSHSAATIGNFDFALKPIRGSINGIASFNRCVVDIRWPDECADVYDITVNEHHNFMLANGCIVSNSVDGDSPAAYRYTEARLTRLATEMLSDIDKDTVDFIPNYDESRVEPTVLPTRIPHLLVNGSSGIAVGMATNIPPHNLSEVIEATIYLIQNPGARLKTLMNFLPGPDFPTGGFIYGREGVLQAYERGRGTVIMRARAAIDRAGKAGERMAIVITEIPYQVNKAKLIERIAELINDKKIEGISDLRDESDREGMRIMIELKRDAIPDIVLNNLYKLTPMQQSFGVINLAIVNGQPRELNLVDTLNIFIEHRRDVVIRRTKYELRKAEARAHILEGLKKAIDQLDAVISTIRKSKSTPEARESLISRFKFTDAQARAILEMQLQRLTGLERQKLVDEYKEVIQRIAELQEILANESVLRNVIVKELREVQHSYGDKRRTEIIEAGAELTLEDLIADEDMAITVTHSGYIKRTPVSVYRAQKRGGTGRRGASLKTEDLVDHLFVASAHSYIMIFTDRGQVYKLKVHEIPDAAAAGRGKAIVNLVNMQKGESVAGIVPVRDFEEGRYVVLVTRKGTIKKTELSEFANIRSNGIIAMGVDDDDELIAAELTDGKKKIFMATHEGMAICFNETDARPMGRPAYGVRGISLDKDDYVISVAAVTGEEDMLSISENGFGKRTNLEEYRLQSRAGKGVINMKTSERNGKVVAVLPVNDESQVLIITNQGKLIRVETKGIRESGRSTQGVKLIDTSDGDQVSSASLIERQQDATDETAN